MTKKKTSKSIPLPILILIYAVLLFAMYLSLSTLALAIWGDSVMGTVDSYDSRLDDTDAGQNRSRTVSKGYWFMANGKEYRGYVIYSSDEAWPSLTEGETRSERIRYLSFLPYVNSPPCCANLARWAKWQLFTTSSPLSVLCFCCCLSYAQPDGGKRRKQRRGNPPHLK